jgi:hypothetical protein
VFDGIVGMTPKVTKDDAALLVTKLFEANLIPENIFVINFETLTGTSYIYFGGFEQSKLKGNVSFLPIVSGSSFWELPGHSILYGSTNLGNFSTAVIDTGSSLAYFPEIVFKAFLAKLPPTCSIKNSLLQCANCTDINFLSSFWINFNGTVVEMPPK